MEKEISGDLLQHDEGLTIAEGFLVIDEKDTGAREDIYSGMCDCYCQSQGCTCDCHDCAFWQNGP